MLTVSDIHTYYGDSYVIQGVSLSVLRGQITVLMGPNGAGKTTVIRSIAGLTRPRHGSILFGGEELMRLPTHEIARRGIGLVPQGRRIFASLSVGEHLAVAASRRREAHRQSANDSRVETNLSDEARRDINSVRVVAGDRNPDEFALSMRVRRQLGMVDRVESAHDMRARQQFRRR
jgi:ABC-type branched-subunit amino acid transport system ATPase component